MPNALGAYSAVDNVLYLNSYTLNKDSYIKLLQNLPNVVSTSHLTTMVHEFIHWQDAQKYITKYGKITNQQEYLQKLRKSMKTKVDKLLANGYNISDISGYALRAYAQDCWDEVYTEYRTRRVLEV